MKFARSLKGRLAVIAAVAIVASGTVVLLFGFFMARSSLREQVFQSLEGVVSRTRRQVQATIDDLGSVAELAASRPALRSGLSAYADGSAEKGVMSSQIAGVLVEVSPGIGSPSYFVAATPDGTVVATNGQNEPGLAVPGGVSRELIIQASLGRTVYSFAAIDGSVVLIAGEPVFRDSSDSLLGVLVLACHSTDLEAELSDTSGLGESGRILLSRQRGDSVVALVPPAAGSGRNRFRTVSLQTEENPALSRSARGERGEGQITEPSGGRVVYAHDYIVEAGWGLYATSSSEEAFSSIYWLRNVNILVIIVLLFGGCALAYLIARSISRPLEQLQEGVKSLGGGELGTRVAISDGTEVTALANEFNTMAARLDDLYRTLEHKVTERTSELQKANDRLKILDELKSEFVSMASHELRSPLSSMKMGVATVAKEMVGPLNDEQKMMLEIAERNIDRLTRLTTDLLDLTKIEAGQLDLDLDEHDFYELAQEIVESDRLLADEKGLRLEVDSRGGPVVARCDRERMYQVIQNLVANALNFTEEGSVTVHVNRSGDLLVVEVADTGPGIAPDALNTIFDKWSQAHSEMRSEKRGTGLGLAICKGIVEAHGGGVSVRSKQGGGSTFTFEVPVRGPDE